MSTQSITLPPQLLNPLQQIASEKGRSVETLVEELVSGYLREQRHTQLLAEMERFRAQHVELLTKYRDEFIAMREGRVLDHDADGGALYARLRRQHGDLPILIVQVTETPEQEFTVRNPKLETAT
jgi:hypothetical protein